MTTDSKLYWQPLIEYNYSTATILNQFITAELNFNAVLPRAPRSHRAFVAGFISFLKAFQPLLFTAVDLSRAAKVIPSVNNLS